MWMARCHTIGSRPQAGSIQIPPFLWNPYREVPSIYHLRRSTPQTTVGTDNKTVTYAIARRALSQTSASD